MRATSEMPKMNNLQQNKTDKVFSDNITFFQRTKKSKKKNVLLRPIE
jgi:hypothetical protein